jgi:uncharacterized protein (TIGR03435 family)
LGSGIRVAISLGMRILAVLIAVGLHGQSFEVASVRQNKIFSCQGRWDFRYSHGTVTAENAPLRRIISRAYHMTDDRVTGPAWLDSECYDIRAKASGAVADRDLLGMLQRLLAERFHMDAHLESDERPVLALFVDKGGPKLHAYDEGAPAPPASRPEGSVLFMVRHMPDLCERIGKVMGRPVIDKTGLTGDYSIVLTYFPLGATGEGADIRSALREQLGLRVEPQKGAVEVLKIDSIEKVPTAN